VEKTILEQVGRASQLLDQHWDSVLVLREMLMEKKELNLNDIVGVLGPRPGNPRPNFKEYQAYAI
jgi:hypothetical protein